jgi:hypothetical protein
MDKNLRSFDRELMLCSFSDTYKAFEYTLKDGSTFRIDTEGILYRKYIRQKLMQGDDLKLKFCIGPDEEYDSNEDSIEHWTIYFFPMYVDDDEISHGSVVEYEDSAVNGNIDIESGRVVSVSSNHNQQGYEELVNPILAFAQELIEAKLTRYS